MMDRYQEVAQEYSDLDIMELVHGKDALRVFEKRLRSQGLRSEEGQRLLWCSYEKGWINGFVTLERAYNFLTFD